MPEGRSMRRTRGLIAIAATAFAALLLAACEDAPTATPEPTPTATVAPTATFAPTATVINGYDTDPCGGFHWPYWGQMHEGFLHWSQEGHRLAFDQLDSLWALDIEEGSMLTGSIPGIGSPRYYYGYYADLSPDGSRFIYTSCDYLVDEPEGYSHQKGYELVAMNVDGTGRTRLTRNKSVEHFPVWSPDGSRIAFMRSEGSAFFPDPRYGEGNIMLVITTADGTELTSRTLGHVALYPPAWSPDGEAIAYVAHEGPSGSTVLVVQTADLGSAEPVRIGKAVSTPSWSPDGEELAFASVEEDVVVVYAARADGTGQREVWRGAGEYGQVQWSPNGSEILIVTDQAYLVRADGSEQRALGHEGPVTHDPRRPLPVSHAAWSPDGRWIALRDEISIVMVSRDGKELRVLAVEGNYPRGWLLAWQPVAERAALEALHSATDGPNWRARPGWPSDSPLRDWYGVATDDFGNVVGLDLSHNFLGGTIPSELAGLSGIEALELDGNQLSGQIPTELVSLTSLRYLRLSGNQFSGCIPDGLLLVQSNDLDQIGLPLCSEAYRNALAALYRATDGPNWTHNTNWLSDAPLGDWYGVQTDDYGRVMGLNLPDNGLAGQIPPELVGLAGLLRLGLAGNQLTGMIPTELGSHTDLEWLRLDGNNLSGCIPYPLREVQDRDLDKLGLSFCLDLNRAALVALFNATDGPNWAQNANWLSGAPLAEWHGVTTNDSGQVTKLELSGNGLRGQLPPELGHLSSLIWLHLFGNQLSGAIPPELGNLRSLRNLDISINGLSGEIPPELGNLENLIYLYLQGNRLSGEIPPELGNLTNLYTLWLEANQLTGRIPRELGDLANLHAMWLQNNRLSGEIPPELGRLTKLGRLNLSWNRLSGEIPPELGNLTNLTSLRLEDNQLTGEIPPELGRLVDLQWLYISDNQLSGVIPSEFGNFEDLRYASLSGNMLSGCILYALERTVPNNDFDRIGRPFC